MGLQNAVLKYKKTAGHSFRITCDKSAVNLLLLPIIYRIFILFLFFTMHYCCNHTGPNARLARLMLGASSATWDLSEIPWIEGVWRLVTNCVICLYHNSGQLRGWRTVQSEPSSALLWSRAERGSHTFCTLRSHTFCTLSSHTIHSVHWARIGAKAPSRAQPGILC